MVGFNINAFLSAVREKGLLFPTNQLVYFPLPAGLLGRGDSTQLTEIARDTVTWCDGSAIPDIIHAGPDIRHSGYGPTEKRVVTFVHSEVPLTFICGADAEQWHLIREWMFMKSNQRRKGSLLQATNLAGGGKPMDPYEVSFPEDWMTNLVISTFSDEGVERMRVVLQDAHPTSMSQIKLGWGERKDACHFTASFAMTSWYFDFEAVTETPSGKIRTFNF